MLKEDGVEEEEEDVGELLFLFIKIIHFLGFSLHGMFHIQKHQAQLALAHSRSLTDSTSSLPAGWVISCELFDRIRRKVRHTRVKVTGFDAEFVVLVSQPWPRLRIPRRSQRTLRPDDNS